MKRQPKITLVELSPTSFGKLNGRSVKDIFTKFFLNARAIPLLKAILLQNGYEDVECIHTDLNKQRGKLTTNDFERIYSSDIVLYSAISRTINPSRESGEDYKRKNPNGIVGVGGYHVTFLPEEALEWADVVVRKEGDKTLLELIDALVNEKNLENIKGISYKKDGQIIHNIDRERLTEQELSELPFPVFEEKQKSKHNNLSLNTSRGCPRNCNFCSVTKFNGRRYRRRTNDSVIGELENLANIRWKPNHIFFSDDNFAAKKRETIELLKFLKTRRFARGNYSCQLDVNSAFNSDGNIDEEFIKLLKQVGFSAVFLGLESMNEETLRSYNKSANVEQNDLAVKAFKNFGLWVHGMMMVGGDGDTNKSLDETVEWAKPNIDSVQFFAPIPLPGTPFTKQMEDKKRILTKDYYLYDGFHVIVKPKNFSPYELQMKIVNMHKKFYSLGWKDIIHPYTFTINSYARKMIWDIEHEPQTQKHFEFLKGDG